MPSFDETTFPHHHQLSAFMPASFLVTANVAVAWHVVSDCCVNRCGQRGLSNIALRQLFYNAFRKRILKMYSGSVSSKARSITLLGMPSLSRSSVKHRATIRVYILPASASSRRSTSYNKVS
jgi:hypothetical protein